MKRIFSILTFVFIGLLMSFTSVFAEDVIRYAEKYSITLGSVEKIPEDKELKNWFSIDLPLNEDNTDIYTTEFDTSKVDLTKAGKYDIKMTFYKTENNKFEKTFTLEITEPIETNDISEINSRYIEKALKITIIVVLVIMIIVTIFDNTETVKIAVVKNNKFIKVISLKQKDNLLLNITKIMKKLKLDSVENIVMVSKNDLNEVQLKQLKTNKKYDYVLYIK